MYLGNPESLEGPLDDMKFARLNPHTIPLALSSKIINISVEDALQSPCFVAKLVTQDVSPFSADAVRRLTTH